MSAPETNIEKQKRRHKPVLVALGVVIVFAGAVFLLNIGSAVDGQSNEGEAAQTVAPDSN